MSDQAPCPSPSLISENIEKRQYQQKKSPAESVFSDPLMTVHPYCKSHTRTFVIHAQSRG